MPDILFPAGRMVGGDLNTLYPVIDDKTNQQKVGKDNKPMFDCSFGYAIPKTGETHWSQTPWGKVIYDTGAAAHPNLVASPAFSWKVTDGDSTIPNKRGKKPCDKVGHPGHWVIWFSQGWLPKRVNATGEVELADGAIQPGYYIQVFGSVAGNKLVPNGTPGVYLNPIAVALVGEGERIATDVDTTKVGFGGAALPAGAKPVTAAAPQFAAPQQAGFPVAGAAVAPFPAQANGATGATTYPSSVVPNPAILQVAPPPAVPQRTMTPKAGGAPYEAFIAQGWTDDMLRQQGYML